MMALGARMRFRLFFAVFALAVALGDTAQASGPVERLVQVMLHPTDPNLMVVRWGVASEGYLYSRDGGKTFAALCSAGITQLAGFGADAGVSSVTRVSSNAVNGNAATLLDSEGHVQLTQLTGLWSDDGTGCKWARALADAWPTSLALDPVSGELLAVVVVTKDVGNDREARSLLVRRSASGVWTSFDQASELVAHVAGQSAYGGELKVTKTATGTRLYASVPVMQSNATTQNWKIAKSDDGGKTWSAGPELPAEQTESFSLVAVDPTNPKRLLAANTDDIAADTLLISEDEGATFQPYGELRELTGIAFAPDGTVYVGDQGDAMDVGGVWTAPALGQPLTKIEGTAGIDCVTWSQGKSALYVCQGDRVRLFDPAQSAFVGDDVVRISEVPNVLSCSDADIGAVCQDQLNMGASWCCTGHYPCTPFCSMYDVTKSATTGQRVFCGKSGLAQDIAVGRTCAMTSADGDSGVPDAGPLAPDAGSLDAGARDAGKIDAGKVTDGTPRKKDDGCALGSSSYGGALPSLGLLLIARRRRRSPRK
jgi:hypothetical protein